MSTFIILFQGENKKNTFLDTLLFGANWIDILKKKVYFIDRPVFNLWDSPSLFPLQILFDVLSIKGAVYGVCLNVKVCLKLVWQMIKMNKLKVLEFLKFLEFLHH